MRNIPVSVSVSDYLDLLSVRIPLCSERLTLQKLPRRTSVNLPENPVEIAGAAETGGEGRRGDDMPFPQQPDRRGYPQIAQVNRRRLTGNFFEDVDEIILAQPHMGGQFASGYRNGEVPFHIGDGGFDILRQRTAGERTAFGEQAIFMTESQ